MQDTLKAPHIQEYPAVLLPVINYKLRIDEELAAHHICRTSPTKNFIHPVTRLIKDEELFIKGTDFFDFSTNHLGQFQLNHNYISLCGENKKYFRDYWEIKESVNTPIHETDFVIDESKGIFFFNIGDIHEKIQFPITNSKNKPDGITAIIKHTPTRSNYWHFSIRWIDNENKEISSTDSKWKIPITGTIRAKLQEIFITDTPKLELIPVEFYLNN